MATHIPAASNLQSLADAFKNFMSSCPYNDLDDDEKVLLRTGFYNGAQALLQLLANKLTPIAGEIDDWRANMDVNDNLEKD